MVNVGKYASPMDPMADGSCLEFAHWMVINDSGDFNVGRARMNEKTELYG